MAAENDTKAPWPLSEKDVSSAAPAPEGQSMASVTKAFQGMSWADYDDDEEEMQDDDQLDSKGKNINDGKSVRKGRGTFGRMMSAAEDEYEHEDFGDDEEEDGGEPAREEEKPKIVRKGRGTFSKSMNVMDGGFKNKNSGDVHTGDKQNNGSSHGTPKGSQNQRQSAPVKTPGQGTQNTVKGTVAPGRGPIETSETSDNPAFSGAGRGRGGRDATVARRMLSNALGIRAPRAGDAATQASRGPASTRTNPSRPQQDNTAAGEQKEAGITQSVQTPGRGRGARDTTVARRMLGNALGIRMPPPPSEGTTPRRDQPVPAGEASTRTPLKDGGSSQSGSRPMSGSTPSHGDGRGEFHGETNGQGRKHFSKSSPGGSWGRGGGIPDGHWRGGAGGRRGGRGGRGRNGGSEPRE